ncbi:hypothetical protein SSX86_018051 [Deinandra increscens subsp. villosa]|uniref:Pentatricopeptide repeat-containing protein n=1 Tax=Deinandra increscens subsp. villosa TaxID=3103831 RepID=A0AAP0GT85_9ASTR
MTETFEHTLIYYPVVMEVWSRVAEWIKKRTQIAQKGTRLVVRLDPAAPAVRATSGSPPARQMRHLAPDSPGLYCHQPSTNNNQQPLSTSSHNLLPPPVLSLTKTLSFYIYNRIKRNRTLSVVDDDYVNLSDLQSNTEMLVTEPATAFRIPALRFAPDCRLLSRSRSLLVPCNKITRRNNFAKSRIRASAEELSGPVKQAKPQRYHPSEDISDSEESDENGDAILGPAETSRTVIEVNSKAMLMFSGAVGDGVHENIFWPDLPYVTDEHGNIYFQVKNDEDILQTLTSEDILVQVIIGLDTTEMVTEMELIGQAESDFDMEDIEDEDSGTDDDDEDDDDDDDDEDDDESGGYENEWVSLLEEGEDDGDPGDWAKLETMRSSHPMHFAKQMAQVKKVKESQVVSDDPVDYMDQPPAGLAIQGVLRPAFIEENSVKNKYMLDSPSDDEEANMSEGKEDDLAVINGHRYEMEPTQDGPNTEEELQKDQISGNGTSYYKLEFVKIHLISAHGNQTFVEVEDFRRAKPDAIAHSASKIISRLKSGGEKTTLALKSLCWRCKGLQVEEVAVIGVDTLGFDVRVCSGRQVQTLRFAFKRKASSEYSAERQLNNLLFPRIPGKQQKQKETHQTEL